MHLHLPRSLYSSLQQSFGCAIGQTITCAVVGYGFACYGFRGKDLLFLLVVFTLIVPPSTLMVPLLIRFSRYGWVDTYLPSIFFAGQQPSP